MPSEKQYKEFYEEIEQGVDHLLEELADYLRSSGCCELNIGSVFLAVLGGKYTTIGAVLLEHLEQDPGRFISLTEQAHAILKETLKDQNPAHRN